MLTGSGRHASAKRREAWRARWRAFLAPQWRRIVGEVLDAQEARVLSLRLGIVSDVGLPQSAIARRLHVTAPTVATIEHRAIEKVRRALNLESTT